MFVKTEPDFCMINDTSRIHFIRFRTSEAGSFHLLGKWCMRSFSELKKQWDDDVSRRRYRPGLVIEDAGLVLGADTILVRMGETRSGAKFLAVEADRERLLSLLGVSYRDQVPPGIVKNIEKASEQWRRGEKALAHIHLALAGLPRLESANDVYRLYLAEALLDDDLSPREMLAELGLDRTMRQLDKFDPDQPRVPAGSGRESGQWAKDGASTSADEDRKVQLAGDVIHVGFLADSFVIHGPDGIPRTFCQYRSAFGLF
jgi:hypothetical protein